MWYTLAVKLPLKYFCEYKGRRSIDYTLKLLGTCQCYIVSRAGREYIKAKTVHHVKGSECGVVSPRRLDYVLYF